MPLGLAEGLLDGERVSVVDAVCDVVGVPDPLKLLLGVAVWEAEGVMLVLPLPLWLRVCVSVAELLPLGLGVPDALPETVGDGLAAGTTLLA